MVGRPSPQSPSISRLTLPPETIPSCYRRTRHTEFQPHSGRHQLHNETPMHTNSETRELTNDELNMVSGGIIFVGGRPPILGADVLNPQPLPPVRG
jgi:hypothetical protein